MSRTTLAQATATETGVAAESIAEVGDFITLLKPRVMSLVVFTGFAGLVIAPGSLHPVLAIVALLCIAVGAGASGAINMWYDRDIDAGMSRTADRPIPAGRMEAGAALGFGATLALGSVAVMGLAANWTAAALLALTIGFYVFVYTIWLKRRTPQNIVIGGAAGAFPPMIGWAAVTGDVGVMPVLLFGIIFMWTPPHFWALALYKKDEYAAVGVPMLPVVAGVEETRRQIVLYSVLLVALTIVPWVLGYAGAIYGVAVTILGIVFIGAALRVWREKGDRSAKAMFAYSILYLFLLFTSVIADALILGIATGGTS